MEDEMLFVFEPRFEEAKESDNPKEALSKLMFELSRNMFHLSDKIGTLERGSDEWEDAVVDLGDYADNLRDVTEALETFYKTE